MSQPDQRYPLQWPSGWKRTPTWQRGHSPFKADSTERAMRDLLDEMKRLGARGIIISSNLKLRNDGLPYANQPRHQDEGIAVYFQRRGKDMVLACDKFAKREANMRAITKTIEAIRGIERWGSSDMMERAFTGFAQLEAPPDIRQWWEVFGVPADAHHANVEATYRRLRSSKHPDHGGSAEDFQAVQTAWETYLRERAP